MSNINTDVDIKVTYRVGLGDISIPKEVYQGLLEIQNEGGFDENIASDNAHKALRWINKNIKESDSYDVEYEVEELVIIKESEVTND